jgi:hypothetical protein
MWSVKRLITQANIKTVQVGLVVLVTAVFGIPDDKLGLVMLGFCFGTAALGCYDARRAFKFDAQLTKARANVTTTTKDVELRKSAVPLSEERSSSEHLKQWAYVSTPRCLPSSRS